MTRSDIVISSWLNTIFSGYYPITFFDCICVVWLHKLILTIICVCRRGGLISAAAFLVKFVHPLGRSPISSRRGGSDCLSFLARVEHPVHLLNDLSFNSQQGYESRGLRWSNESHLNPHRPPEKCCGCLAHELCRRSGSLLPSSSPCLGFHQVTHHSSRWLSCQVSHPRTKASPR